MGPGTAGGKTCIARASWRREVRGEEGREKERGEEKEERRMEEDRGG